MRSWWFLALVGCSGGGTEPTDATDDTDVVVDDACRATWPIDIVGTEWVFGPAEGWRGGPFVATELAAGAGTDELGRSGWRVSTLFQFERPEGERFVVLSERLYRCGPDGYGILYETEQTELETPDRTETSSRTVTYTEPMIEIGLDIAVGGRWRSVTERVVVEDGEQVEDGRVSRSCIGMTEEPAVIDGVPAGVRFACVGDLDLEIVVADGVGPVQWGDFRRLIEYGPPE